MRWEDKLGRTENRIFKIVRFGNIYLGSNYAKPNHTETVFYSAAAADAAKRLRRTDNRSTVGVVIAADSLKLNSLI